MNTKPSITAITGSRIYFGEPVDEPTGTYITINIVSENQRFANKATRIDVRFIAHDQDTRYRQLMDLRNIVIDELATDGTTVDMGWFVVYGIVEEGGVVNGYNEKGHRVVIQDFLVYFAR